jgi:hypothetical protein
LKFFFFKNPLASVGGPAVLLNDLTANDKTVHADFFHNFGDLFDDNDLN